MTTVDLKALDYRDEPFVLAKDVTQVFYVQDMSSKPKKDKYRSKSSFVGAGDEPKRHIVLAGKRKIVVAEPPKLIQLKCPNYHLHALQQSNMTVCRVKSP